MGQAEENLRLGGNAIKPKGWDRTGMEAFKFLLYNPDTGEILTRTPLSWLKITVFYITYYCFLAGFWAACLMVFFLTIPEADVGPKWQQDWGLIGKNPGVGIRPAPPDEMIDSQMFFLKKSDNNMESSEGGEGHLNIDYAVRMENNFKKYYNVADDGHPLQLCGENTLRKEGDLACQFDMAQLGDCQNFPYGFVTEGEEGNINPCIFLKLNKIYGWEPTPLTWETIEKYPSDYEDMTDELKEIIKNTEDPDQIWMDCKGRYAADKEVLDMDFFPKSQGIPIKYFPFQGGKYEPPLVAVRLNMNQDNTPTGQLIHVQCKAWFEGVKHANREKAGMVMFEVILNEITPRCADC